ncbi:uncharacterized protein BDV14DRAFT_200031 [Aspergillus stella-maris]|uniref:uncharacterized protein n=1 Tax=Aspergillus stella-maris TaxID=1810926 RepID=UPI003CCD6C78
MEALIDTAFRDTRKRHRQELSAIFENLVNLGNQLSKTDLAKLRIHREEINLDNIEPFQFFSKYSAAIQSPEIDTVRSNYPRMSRSDEAAYLNSRNLAYHMNRFFQKCLLPNKAKVPTSTSYGVDFNFGSLCDTSIEYEWAVLSAWNMRTPGLPHMVALMFTGITAANELLRSELTAIIRIMHGRLRSSKTRPHTIAPVLMFSIAGKHHIRVIEAFYDGKTRQLIVRTSRLCSIAKPCDKFYLELCKWWLGHASEESTTDMYEYDDSLVA